MKPLPSLMVAPNGARLGHADHPALPLSLPEIVTTARACQQAGADGLHLHLRDGAGKHVLDAGLYREALSELSLAVPQMAVQITTESLGRYKPAFLRHLALEARGAMVSAALREITADDELTAARAMHRACREQEIAVQYILYAPDEVIRLPQLLGPQEASDPALQVLFVLGGHGGRPGAPEMLDGFLAALRKTRLDADWMVCAFGQPETDCLLAAHAAGGKLRVGFENSLWHQSGQLARDNAERVAEICRLLQAGPAQT